MDHGSTIAVKLGCVACAGSWFYNFVEENNEFIAGLAALVAISVTLIGLLGKVCQKLRSEDDSE
jgi:hypothetical protein